MKIVSTNIAKPTNIVLNGKQTQTGIYKKSVNQPISLGFTDVVGDAVMNREDHGGIDKACYLYSADHYLFWKERNQKITVKEVYNLFSSNLENLDLAKKAFSIPTLSQDCKDDIQKMFFL